MTADVAPVLHTTDTAVAFTQSIAVYETDPDISPAAICATLARLGRGSMHLDGPLSRVASGVDQRMVSAYAMDAMVGMLWSGRSIGSDLMDAASSTIMSVLPTSPTSQPPTGTERAQSIALMTASATLLDALVPHMRPDAASAMLLAMVEAWTLSLLSNDPHIATATAFAAWGTFVRRPSRMAACPARAIDALVQGLRRNHALQLVSPAASVQGGNIMCEALASLGAK